MKYRRGSTIETRMIRREARQELNAFIRKELAEIDRRRGVKPAPVLTLTAQVEDLVARGLVDLASKKQTQAADVLRWLKS